MTTRLSSSHDVQMFVDKDHYDDCIFDDATQLAGRGEDLMYVFDAPGTYYLGCSVGSHCGRGQKVKIEVTAPGGSRYPTGFPNTGFPLPGRSRYPSRFPTRFPSKFPSRG